MLFRSGRLRSGRASDLSGADRLSGRQEGVHQRYGPGVGTHVRRDRIQRVRPAYRAYAGGILGRARMERPDQRISSDAGSGGYDDDARAYTEAALGMENLFFGRRAQQCGQFADGGLGQDGDGLPGGLARRVRSRCFAGKAVPDAGRAERREDRRDGRSGRRRRRMRFRLYRRMGFDGGARRNVAASDRFASAVSGQRGRDGGHA